MAGLQRGRRAVGVVGADDLAVVPHAVGPAGAEVQRGAPGLVDLDPHGRVADGLLGRVEQVGEVDEGAARGLLVDEAAPRQRLAGQLAGEALAGGEGRGLGRVDGGVTGPPGVLEGPDDLPVEQEALGAVHGGGPGLIAARLLEAGALVAGVRGDQRLAVLAGGVEEGGHLVAGDLTLQLDHRAQQAQHRIGARRLEQRLAAGELAFEAARVGGVADARDPQRRAGAGEPRVGRRGRRGRGRRRVSCPKGQEREREGPREVHAAEADRATELREPRGRGRCRRWHGRLA